MNDNGIKCNIDLDEERELFIKEIDKYPINENYSYQLILNKLSLTPYLYELNNIHPVFNNYKRMAKSSVSSFILHPYQYILLKELNKKKNIIVSAPTSFGKTAAIFEYISQNKKTINNILIIVPTIALRNEYLEKINTCLYKHTIITNSNDISNYKSFCMILTHEKFIETFIKNKFNELKIDLLVIDEIYKLQNEKNVERMYSMSLAYITAIKISKQYVFLGPFINSINLNDIDNYELKKYNYSPIAVNMEYIPYDEYNYESLIANINSNEKTLVYFSNKNEIIDTLDSISDSVVNTKNKELLDYIATEFDSDWLKEWNVLKGLKCGIGVHYNELPSFIKEYVLDSYNNTSDTMVLFATSTLLEGVNTSTKKIIITSNKIGNSKLSDFEFWNLVGRAGRLGKYKVGNVLYYGNKEDFKKENRFIDLDNLWINDENNIDEYEIVNDEKLSDKDKQHKLETIMSKYKITIDDIKFMYLPFFKKIDNVFDFFDKTFDKLVLELHDKLHVEKGVPPSRDIRKAVFDKFINKYKRTINTGPLPSNHFSILSDAINMAYPTKTSKIINIVNNGRTILKKRDFDDNEKKIRINNLYNYSFYMVNNYIENSYLPGMTILKKLFIENNVFNKQDWNLINDYIFIQVEKYKTMIYENEIYETLGIINPLIQKLKESFGNVEVKNISELKKLIIDNRTKIDISISSNNLLKHYFKILLRKLQI